METRNCKHCDTEFKTNYPAVIRNPNGSVMWEGRKNLIFCDACIDQGKGGMPIEIPDIIMETPDIQHIYGVSNGKEFIDDASAGFRMLKYKVRKSDGLVIALFDEKKVPIDKTPDVYECKHCDAWFERGDVHFDNRCEPICFPCLGEQRRLRNSSPRKG